MPFSDFLETILLRLSQRVVEVTPNSTYIQCLHNLLDSLAEWENPLTTLAHVGQRWCLAISEKLGDSDQGRNALENRLSSRRPGLGHPHDEIADKYAALLLMALKIGFRQSEPGGFTFPYTVHHHEWMFKVLFSGDDDEVIADGLCAWLEHLGSIASPCVHHLIGRVEKGAPFSPRLRRTIVHVIENVHSWGFGVGGSELETARLLNHFDLHVDARYWTNWKLVLVDVIRSPTGREVLSSYYWHLLGTLMSTGDPFLPGLCDADMEVLRFLDDVEDWEKLELWMLVVWPNIHTWSGEEAKGVEPMTLKLFHRRPSTIPRFESLYEGVMRSAPARGQLLQICSQARAEQLPSVSSPL